MTEQEISDTQSLQPPRRTDALGDLDGLAYVVLLRCIFQYREEVLLRNSALMDGQDWAQADREELAHSAKLVLVLDDLAARIRQLMEGGV
jgi:hypothetical protein